MLWVNKTPISYFYDEPRNSLDIMYIGSSNSYHHFNTVLAYNQYGYTTGMMATDDQIFAVVKYLIKETEKYQKPQVYVIDILQLAADLNLYVDGNIRNNTDSMRFSINRLNAINELLPYIDVDKSDYSNYYFSFLLYHNRWKNINRQNFDNTSLYKGYLFSGDTIKIDPYEEFAWSENIIELPEENKRILMNLINYIKENNLKVLFVIPIRTLDSTRNERLNDASNIIKQNGLDIINFNTLEDFDIDFSKDLYNHAHLNAYGVVKYTLFFGKYLKEHYDLKSHKGDNTYASWENEYDRFKQDFKNLTNQNFDDILLEYQQNKK